MKWLVCIYYTDLQNCLFIKYKDEYQKSKWTIECKIFISFIWSRSELWKPYNDNVFTKKLIFATYIGMSTGSAIQIDRLLKKSKIMSMVKWPLRGLRRKSAVEIWYLNENEVIWDILGHIGPKQPRNYKFEIGYAQAKSAKPHWKQYVDFINSCSFFTCTNSES